MVNEFNTAVALKEAGMYHPLRAHAITSGVLAVYVYIFL
jgi:hypothetical protein